MPLFMLTGSLALQTRAKTSIDNHFNRRELDDGERMEAEALKRQYPHATPRPAGLTAAYNCHGLTFASRRSGISNSTEISKILREDEYQEVERQNVLAGDIVVYFKDGDIEHSGIVIEKLPYGTRVLSKWGTAYEFIHMVGDCPYDGSG